MINYHAAIAEIVNLTAEGSTFETYAIMEVADDHGEDPMHVKRDVADLRKAIAQRVYNREPETNPER